MKMITITFVEQPGDAQIVAMTVRAKGDTVAALQSALAFVQGVTTIPIERVAIDLPSAKGH